MEKEPLLDEGMRKWIAYTAYTRAWQFPDQDVEDLISEGYICYAQCKERYGHNFAAEPSKGDRKWFMSLVKRSYSNRLTSMQRKVCRRPRHVTLEDNHFERCNVDLGMQGFVDILLSAPVEVLQVFRKLVEEGHVSLSNVTREAVCLTLSGSKRRRLRYRETTNEQLCRLVGCDPKIKNIHRDILNLLEKS